MFLALPSAHVGVEQLSLVVGELEAKVREAQDAAVLDDRLDVVRRRAVTLRAPGRVVADLHDVAHQRTRSPGVAPGQGSST